MVHRWLLSFLGACALAGCVDVEEPPSLSDERAALVAPEGQGSDMQGSDMQGSDMQGSDMQGSDMQGVTLGGMTGTAYLDGTRLRIRRQLSALQYEDRFPDRICLGETFRGGSSYTCTPVNLWTTPSPLAGAVFTTKIRLRDGSERPAKMRIGTSTSTLWAVWPDGSRAMHPLTGTSASSGCTLVPKGQSGCEHPQGCRMNCDLWIYQVQLLYPNDSTATQICPNNGYAYAVPGTYSATGQRQNSSTQFSLACPTGTIAKCTRWGYRPFGWATDSAGTWRNLADYHQSCVRAAMADYCSNGTPFTRDGTLVDVYDYDPAFFGVAGFVPRGKTLLGAAATALSVESTWDPAGAREIDYMRYPDRITGTSVAASCPDRFEYIPGDDVGLSWHRRFGLGTNVGIVSIDSTTGCSHSELTGGLPLNKHCNACVFEVQREGFHREYCSDPNDPRGWDALCVERALSVCTTQTRQPMTEHSECATGEALGPHATGCTMRVCRDNPACCTSSWTSACVAAASSVCGKADGTFCSATNATPPPPPTL